MSDKASLRLQQEVADTYRLAFVGGYFYFTAWLIVAYYGKAFEHSSLIAWIMTTIFAVLAASRGLHRTPANIEDARTCMSWLKQEPEVVHDDEGLVDVLRIDLRTIDELAHHLRPGQRVIG